MKNIIVLLLWLIPCSSFSSYYFISQSLGNDANAGTCQAQPIKTLAKLATITLVAGDVVFLKRGDTWRENYTIQQSGTSTAKIVFDAYGTGALPIVNGADLVTGTWATFNTNVQSIALAFTTTMAWLNGVWQQPARFPNTGYLTITSASTTTGLTSTSLTQATNFWVGANVSIKPDKFLWEQSVVTASTAAGHLTFNATSNIAPVGNGFYLWGLLSILDTVREFANSGGRLYIWFGGIPPASQTVEVSRRQFGFIAANKSNVTIQNIHFTKNFEDGVELTNCTNFTVQYCETDQMYKKGVQATSCPNITISNNYIHDCYGKGVMMLTCSGRNNINANRVLRIGQVPGYGTNGEIGGQGLEVDVNGSDTSFISENYLDSISYNGIRFSKRCYISKNDVEHFCQWLDDGGAYYTFGAGNGANCYLVNNIARYGIGNNQAIRAADTGFKAAGIYLDDNSGGTTATGNTIDSVSWIGGFFHNSSSNVFTGNTFFGCGKLSAFVQQTDASGTTGSILNSLVGNIFYSANAGVRSLYNWNAAANDTTHFGTYSGNYYINPYLATPIRVEEPLGANNYTVAQFGGQDLTGKTNVNGAPPVNLNVIFVNNTYYSKTFNLVGTYKNIVGASVSGSITLLPFTSQILVAPTSVFVSTTDGDDNRTLSQAQNPATPWKTLAKVNANWGSYAAGNSILLKRGDVFDGSLTSTTSGSSSLPITLSYYGTATNPPTINGLVTTSGWTNLGGGVWESAALTTGTTVNMVLIDGLEYAMGRTPNLDNGTGGYLTFQAHTSNSITDNTNPFNNTWTNATLLVRTTNSSLEQTVITGVSGNVISFSPGFTNDPTNNYGYFVENDIKTLDQFGEWFYNTATKKIDMFFGADVPTAHTIQASAIDVLLTVHSDFLTVYGVNFIGANTYAIYNDNAGVDNLTIKNTNVYFSGLDGMAFAGVTNFLMDSSLIQYANSLGIDLFFSNPTAIIRNSNFKDIATFNGMMKKDVGNRQSMGMYNADGMNCLNNNFLNMGYIGIYFLGNNNLIQNNYVDRFCTNLDDGGGIYTWVGGSDGTYSNRNVVSNIVVNGIGANAGTSNPTYIPAEGIYMDDNVNNVNITNNTIANCANNGIFLHNARTINMRGNLIYNNLFQIGSQHDGGGDAATGISNKTNKLLARTSTQLVVKLSSVNNDFSAVGTFDSNYYARPIAQTQINETNWFSNATTDYTLAQWKSAFPSYDVHTVASPISISSVNDILFQYNATTVNKTIYFNGNYIGLDGTVYPGSVILSPFTSIALLKMPLP